jgi:Flp pilus assembly protein TadB
MLAAIAIVAGIGGLAAASLGVMKVPVTAGTPHRAWVRSWLRRLLRRTPAQYRRRKRILIGAMIGLVFWLTTGWAIAIVVIPAAFWGLPILLETSSNKATIARLEAMGDWAQNVSSVLGVGIGIEQAITASLRSTPEPIRNEVARLVARLQARWDTIPALQAFADDLDDATGDFIGAALILGATRRGNQLSSVLDGLAAAVRDDVRVRRTIAAEQVKSETTARMVTVISTSGLGLMLLTPYADPYRTTAGQLILSLLLAGYVGCLIWMRRMTALPRQPRILAADGTFAERSA